MPKQLPGILPGEANRLAEFAGGEIADIGQVLDVEGLVESPVGPHPGIVFCGGINIQQSIQRIAGKSTQSEYNHADGDQRNQGMEESYQYKALHFAIPADRKLSVGILFFLARGGWYRANGASSPAKRIPQYMP